jgi:hypothetical protein
LDTISDKVILTSPAIPALTSKIYSYTFAGMTDHNVSWACIKSLLPPAAPKYYWSCVKRFLPPAAAKYYFERHVIFMILRSKIMKMTSVSNLNLA